MNSQMSIQVLGSGCPTCKQLFELTKRAAEELGMETEVEYITDIQKIMAMGVMQSPVLAINNQPVLSGAIKDIEEIKQAILQAAQTRQPETTGSSCGCGCGCGENC